MIKKLLTKALDLRTSRRSSLSKNTFVRPKSTTKTTSGTQRPSQCSNSPNTERKIMATGAKNHTTKRTTTTTTVPTTTTTTVPTTTIATTTTTIATTMIATATRTGSTRKEKAATITTEKEGAITGTIMRRSQEMITGERRRSLSLRRRTVVIIDEVLWEDLIFCRIKKNVEMQKCWDLKVFQKFNFLLNYESF